MGQLDVRKQDFHLQLYLFCRTFFPNLINILEVHQTLNKNSDRASEIIIKHYSIGNDIGDADYSSLFYPLYQGSANYSLQVKSGHLSIL